MEGYRNHEASIPGSALEMILQTSSVPFAETPVVKVLDMYLLDEKFTKDIHVYYRPAMYAVHLVQR